MDCWSPPGLDRFKVNFDRVIFGDVACIGVIVVIRNERGECMATLSNHIIGCLNQRWQRLLKFSAYLLLIIQFII